MAGVLLAAAWVRRQRRLADPMIDLQLFRIRAFNAALAVNFLAILVSVGYFLFVAQYLQLVVGLSPFQAGLWSLPSAAGFIVGSQLGPRIVRFVRPAYLVSGALVAAAAGLLVLTQVTVTDGLTEILIGSVVISLGLGPVFGLTTEMIVGSAPPEKAGAASGISETAAELGAALGIAVLGSVGVAIYRAGHAGLPTGVPAAAAAAARDTLGGAVARRPVARRRPGPRCWRWPGSRSSLGLQLDPRRGRRRRGAGRRRCRGRDATARSPGGRTRRRRAGRGPTGAAPLYGVSGTVGHERDERRRGRVRPRIGPAGPEDTLDDRGWPTDSTRVTRRPSGRGSATAGGPPRARRPPARAWTGGWPASCPTGDDVGDGLGDSSDTDGELLDDEVGARGPAGWWPGHGRASRTSTTSCTPSTSASTVAGASAEEAAVHLVAADRSSTGPR